MPPYWNEFAALAVDRWKEITAVLGFVVVSIPTGLLAWRKLRKDGSETAGASSPEGLATRAGSGSRIDQSRQTGGARFQGSAEDVTFNQHAGVPPWLVALLGVVWMISLVLVVVIVVNRPSTPTVEKRAARFGCAVAALKAAEGDDWRTQCADLGPEFAATDSGELILRRVETELPRIAELLATQWRPELLDPLALEERNNLLHLIGRIRALRAGNPSVFNSLHSYCDDDFDQSAYVEHIVEEALVSLDGVLRALDTVNSTWMLDQAPLHSALLRTLGVRRDALRGILGGLDSWSCEEIERLAASYKSLIDQLAEIDYQLSEYTKARIVTVHPQ